MMISANNGVGMNIGFPDVCLTPAAPAPIPIPYPNLASNAMAVPFSPNIKVGFMPALNMAAKIPMTNGDNAGVAHPLFMQMGQYTLGNFFVFVNCIPAVNLLIPTTGNMMNNPVGAVLVPSVSMTLYTDAQAAADVGTSRRVSAKALSRLNEAVATSNVHATLNDGVARVVVPRFSSDVTTRVFSALHGLRLDDIERVELDLRGNPGGDVEAALRLADDFVEAGTPLAIRDENGETFAHAARQSEPYTWPLSILVDADTASAAELFAGALQQCGRATLIGTATAGKASSQAVVIRGRGCEYRGVCTWRLADGTSFADSGLSPQAEA